MQLSLKPHIEEKKEEEEGILRAITIEKKEIMCKTLPDMEFDFLEFNQGEREVINVANDHLSDDDEDQGLTETAIAKSKAFWEEQHQLQEALSRNSTTELRIRSATEEALTRMRAAGTVCSCSKELCCRTCTLRDVADRLRDARYNNAVCKSKWVL